MLGAARSQETTIDTNAYGDGYTHRSTRGINPSRATWSLSFPIVGQEDVDKYDDFFNAYQVGGFWWNPPDMPTKYVFVIVNNWSISMSDKNIKEGIIGVLQVSFVQTFNPQEIHT
jgi:phage-related protein